MGLELCRKGSHTRPNESIWHQLLLAVNLLADHAMTARKNKQHSRADLDRCGEAESIESR